MARTGRNGYMHAKKETTWGTYVTPDLVIRFSTESLNRQVKHVEDAAQVGEIYPTEMIKTSDGVAGSIEMAMHGDTCGPLLHGTLGSDTISTPWNAIIIVHYNGTSDYARLTKSGTTLTAEISSDDSSWSGDSNFGSSGDIDLSAGSYDTMTELQAAIDGYTGYSATLFGDGTADTSTIADFTATYLWEDDAKTGGFALKARISPTAYQNIANTGNLGAFTGATVPGIATQSDYELDVTITDTDGTETEYQLANISINIADDWSDVAAAIQTSLQAATSGSETVTITSNKIKFTAADTDFIVVSAGTAGTGSGDLLGVIDALGADYTTDIETAYGAVSKQHSLIPASATSNLPSYTIQVNRSLASNESIAFTGIKFSSAAITITAEDLVKMSLAATGKLEDTGKNDISLSVPTVQAFTAANTTILLSRSDGSQVDFDEVKDLSLTVNTSIDESRVIGSLYKKEQTRQGATIDLSFTANNTSNQYAVREDYINDTGVEMFLYMESNSEADSTNSVPYAVLVRLPKIKLTAFDSPISSPDRLTITGSGTIVKPQNSVYTEHIYIDVVDADTSSY